MQIEAETKRTLSIPNHVLSLEAKDAIMRQKYTATMKPVSAVPFKNDSVFSFHCFYLIAMPIPSAYMYM